MAFVNSHYGYCAAGSAAPKFTYTGQYNVREDGVVELLTSGTLVFLEPKVIDVFCVGGGGSGGTRKSGDDSHQGFGGGGGGRTATLKRASVNGSIEVVIGNGGQVAINSDITQSVANGGTTSFGTLISAAGGHGHYYSMSFTGRRNGTDGGSGGGGGVASNTNYGTGGSDGGNGERGFPSTLTGGEGQGSTTREFGDATGKLYGGGGGGGRYFAGDRAVVSLGGTGGGGAGAWAGNSSQAASAGGANTGGGGGGGAMASSVLKAHGASGGSGICCFRVAAPLPELDGTWVLNERLYAPESAFSENVNFNASETATGTQRGFTGVKNNTINGQLIFFNAFIDEIIYYYSSNTWGANNLKYLTFPAGATASDEFRAWLASNATKQ